MSTNILEVQKFLETHTIGELAEQWGVYARCDKFGYKFSLNYDMIEFTPGHKPSEQCRGIVLTSEDYKNRYVPHLNCKVDNSYCPGKTIILAYPFDKFYNEQEGFASKIDWSTAKVQEKLDGTLCILYFDPFLVNWSVATRSVPNADLPIDGHLDQTFRNLFEKGVKETFNLNFSDFVKYLDKDCTWLFELTSPYNRVFVDYKNTNVTLLGIRNNITLKEINPFELKSELKFQLPILWNLSSVKDVSEFVNELSPEKFEGAVITDANFNRIKIKNLKWVVANSVKTTLGTSPRNLLKYILMGSSDDMISMLPEDLKSKLDKMQDGLRNLCKKTDEKYLEFKSLANDNRKYFAELVNIHNVFTNAFYVMYSKKYNSSLEYLRDLLNKDRLTTSMIDDLIKIISK